MISQPSDARAAMLASGAALFGQGSRLLKLRFAEDRCVAAGAMLPHRAAGEEALSANYRYVLDCLSADAYLELKELLGQPVEISLLLPDGGERLLTGLVTRAEHHGTDGGFAKYTLTIEPALATLVHRRNSRVFQDRSVPQIVATIRDEHLASNLVFTQRFQYQAQLSQTCLVRSYCLQYREPDLVFIERLLAEEGISYRYTRGPDPETSRRESDSALAEGSEENAPRGIPQQMERPMDSLLGEAQRRRGPGQERSRIPLHRPLRRRHRLRLRPTGAILPWLLQDLHRQPPRKTLRTLLHEQG